MIFKDKLLFDLLNRVSNLENEISILKNKKEKTFSSYEKVDVLATGITNTKVDSKNIKANRNDILKILNNNFKASDLNFVKSNYPNKILVTDQSNTTVLNVKLFNSKKVDGNKNKVWSSWHTLNSSDIDDYDIFIFTVKINHNVEIFILSHANIIKLLEQKKLSDRCHFRIFKAVDGNFYDQERKPKLNPIEFNIFHNNLLPFYNIKS